MYTKARKWNKKINHQLNEKKNEINGEFERYERAVASCMNVCRVCEKLVSTITQNAKQIKIEKHSHK